MCALLAAMTALSAECLQTCARFASQHLRHRMRTHSSSDATVSAPRVLTWTQIRLCARRASHLAIRARMLRLARAVIDQIPTIWQFSSMSLHCSASLSVLTFQCPHQVSFVKAANRHARHVRSHPRFALLALRATSCTRIVSVDNRAHSSMWRTVRPASVNTSVSSLFQYPSRSSLLSSQWVSASLLSSKELTKMAVSKKVQLSSLQCWP